MRRTYSGKWFHPSSLIYLTFFSLHETRPWKSTCINYTLGKRCYVWRMQSYRDTLLHFDIIVAMDQIALRLREYDKVNTEHYNLSVENFSTFKIRNINRKNALGARLSKWILWRSTAQTHFKYIIIIITIYAFKTALACTHLNRVALLCARQCSKGIPGIFALRNMMPINIALVSYSKPKLCKHLMLRMKRW